MFEDVVLKKPRILKFKKLHRGVFKVIKYNYNCTFTFFRPRVFRYVFLGSGFFRWKTVVELQGCIKRILKKERKSFDCRFDVALTWSVSHKTHKSRMGKGKGVVEADDWRIRIKAGKSLIIILNKELFIDTLIKKNLIKSVLALPVQTVLI